MMGSSKAKSHTFDLDDPLLFVFQHYPLRPLSHPLFVNSTESLRVSVVESAIVMDQLMKRHLEKSVCTGTNINTFISERQAPRVGASHPAKSARVEFHTGPLNEAIKNLYEN